MENTMQFLEETMTDAMKGSFQRGIINGMLQADVVMLQVMNENRNITADELMHRTMSILAEKRLEILNNQ